MIEIKPVLRVCRIHDEAAGGNHVGVGDDTRQLVDQRVVAGAAAAVAEFAGQERGIADSEIVPEIGDQLIQPQNLRATGVIKRSPGGIMSRCEELPRSARRPIGQAKPRSARWQLR